MSPCFHAFALHVFCKHCGKRRNSSLRAISPFPIVFSTLSENPAIFIKFDIVVCKLKNFDESEIVIWERVNPVPNKPWFLHVCSKSLLKTLWEKEKFLITSNFFFSHSVFYSFGELCHFHQNLKLSSANSLNFVESETVVCERVKGSINYFVNNLFYFIY